MSVLLLLTKEFERLIFDKLSKYLKKYLFSFLCGFLKASSIEHALFKLLPAWQEEPDKIVFLGIILADLSKAYDCLPHHILVAKLEVSGIGKASLNLIHSYEVSIHEKRLYTMSTEKYLGV